ncbi:YfdX family protein [Acidihalobacter ferrooxydans]|uniref:Uncharacterized protein n=1 Tax=Acidihalobacter ferrooxydans TaxID=1765967 RepID=A0A1P8UHN2_9GAMM|nr:YfdX family protein [Acidihalobacter ferrooxydans]APZ43327.1 hypothetical protein BW247_09645 [Acidihalobacter ferrooxydans]
MRLRTALIATIAAAAFSLGIQAQAATGLRPDIRSLNRMQVYAAQALADSEEARAALHDGAPGTAANALSKTRTLLELIHSRLPAAEFQAMLRAMGALMSFEDNKQVLPMFQRLFFALDDLPHDAAREQARKALKRAQADLQKTDRAGAISALTQAGAPYADPVLTPPLKAAGQALTAANAALVHGNGSQAETNLVKLATDLLKLHKALATYPLTMTQNAPPHGTRNP